MLQRNLLTKQNISIALIWLFHVSGLIGIIYSNASWFIKGTPVNLLLSFSLLLLNTEWSKKMLFLVVLCFATGMLAEILGVQYGFIFGEYSYGKALGIKFMNVPLMIGINWCILIFITGFIAQFFLNKLWSRALLGTALMLTLDLVMEPVAPVLDFWTFTTGLASFHNYFGWALVAFPLQLIFHKAKVKMEGPFPFH
ncbi:carotenoid biosynthesis protein, partial [Flavobacteriaceae bacterium]|nr:carotenoid biosynthesis protein [Flavobacteriaceae bacterium]